MMIYREYEIEYSDYNNNTEYRITITTDLYKAYRTMKDAIEQIASIYEEQKGGDDE